MKSELVYSVEEIYPFEGGYRFWTGDMTTMLSVSLGSYAAGCIRGMGNKLTDYGVSVFEEADVVYIMRSHFTLPVVPKG